MDRRHPRRGDRTVRDQVADSGRLVGRGLPDQGVLRPGYRGGARVLDRAGLDADWDERAGPDGAASGNSAAGYGEHRRLVVFRELARLWRGTRVGADDQAEERGRA